MEHNALRSWHATMYIFVTSMVFCGLGMQQCAMHNATIQKTTFFELDVFIAIGTGIITVKVIVIVIAIAGRAEKCHRHFFRKLF